MPVGLRGNDPDIAAGTAMRGEETITPMTIRIRPCGLGKMGRSNLEGLREDHPTHASLGFPIPNIYVTCKQHRMLIYTLILMTWLLFNTFYHCESGHDDHLPAEGERKRCPAQMKDTPATHPFHSLNEYKIYKTSQTHDVVSQAIGTGNHNASDGLWRRREW